MRPDPPQASDGDPGTSAALRYVDQLGLRGAICADMAPAAGDLCGPLYVPRGDDAHLWEPATRKAAAFLRVLSTLRSDPYVWDREGPWATAYDALCWLAATPSYHSTMADLLHNGRCGNATWAALCAGCARLGITSPQTLVASRPAGVPPGAWPSTAFDAIPTAAQRPLLAAAGLTDSGVHALLVTDVTSHPPTAALRGSTPLRSLAVIDEPAIRREALLQTADYACACMRRVAAGRADSSSLPRDAWEEELTTALFWLTLADDDIRALTAYLARYAVPDWHVRRAALAWSAIGYSTVDDALRLVQEQAFRAPVATWRPATGPLAVDSKSGGHDSANAIGWNTLPRPDAPWRTYDPFLDADLGFAERWSTRGRDLCQALLTAPPPTVLQRGVAPHTAAPATDGAPMDVDDDPTMPPGDTPLRPDVALDRRGRPASDGTVSPDAANGLAARLRSLALSPDSNPEQSFGSTWGWHFGGGGKKRI